MKINIGCGDHLLEGFINLDHRPGYGDQQENAANLSFENNSIEEIYAGHILEHFDWSESDQVLSEWFRVLKSGGRITIAVPDAIKSAKLVEQNLMDKNFYAGLNYGWGNGNTRNNLKDFWQNHGDDGTSHLSFWTAGILKKVLKENGFIEIQELESSPYTLSHDNSCGWQTIITAIKP